MNSKVKKVTCIILVLIIMSLTTVLSYAARENIISAGEIAVKPGEVIQIPVSISENQGIMGFAIEVEFDENFLKPVSAERGDALQSGMFEDSIGTVAVQNCFKVIWCGTEDVKDNGIVFVLTFEVLENVTGNTEVKFSYVEEDTFNEKWEEVKLTCEDIIVSINNNAEMELTFWQKLRKVFLHILDLIASLFFKFDF